MVINSGVFPSIHQNCHHELFFAKLNLNIFYPPPYRRCTWYYDEANHEAINNAIASFNWEKAFSNINVCTQNKLLIETLTNIFKNFVLNKLITVDNKDPPWVTKNIKKL